MPIVSLIIATSNINRHVHRLLESIAKQTFSSFEVITVSHRTREKNHQLALSKLPKKVKHYHFNNDLGFCKANNLAAEKTVGKYLFFLNDDVTLDQNCLKNLIASFSQLTHHPPLTTHNQIAVIQPKIRSSKFPSFFEYAGAAGGLIDKWGYPFCRGRVLFTIEEDQGQYDKNGEIFWATGTAFFINKDIFLKFGGFDERFYAYHEETDLCWRLRKAGYRIVFEPKAIVYHEGEKSWRHRRFLKIFLIHRNHYWLLSKNNSISQFFRLLPGKLFLDLAVFLYYAIHGGFQSCFAAILGSITGLFISPFFMTKLIPSPRGSHGFASSACHPRGDNDSLIYPGSIAISYFLKNKKTYHQLMEEKKPPNTKTKEYSEFF